MSKFYGLPKQWGGSYAIPEYILAEGLKRSGARTTAQAPERTYDAMQGVSFRGPLGDNPFARVLPAYIKAEAIGQGAHSTAWLPRGTRDQIQDNFGQNRPEPIAAGIQVEAAAQAAKLIVAQAWAHPAIYRIPALRQALQAVHASLWQTVGVLATQLEQRGADAIGALEQALTQALAKLQAKYQTPKAIR